MFVHLNVKHTFSLYAFERKAIVLPYKAYVMHYAPLPYSKNVLHIRNKKERLYTQIRAFRICQYVLKLSDILSFCKFYSLRLTIESETWYFLITLSTLLRNAKRLKD